MLQTSNCFFFLFWCEPLILTGVDNVELSVNTVSLGEF